MTSHATSDRPSADVVQRAVEIIMVTNRCDAAAARQILASTAARNRLDEADVAITVVAMRSTPRRSSRSMR